MVTVMEKHQKGLLKKFHTLLGKAGVNEDGKREILASYKVVSSKDLTAYELLQICDRLEGLISPSKQEVDKWRKRVMAAIGSYLRAMGYEENRSVIYSIACRASGVENFNKIGVERLRSIYNAFNHKRNDIMKVDEISLQLGIKSEDLRMLN